MWTDDFEYTQKEPASNSPDAALRYSIVIPAWNESAHIQQTIESVLEAQAVQKLRGDIIVVDNNSSDDTAAKATVLGARVVFEPVNQIARARNTGAAAASTDFLIFLDADTTINASLLKMTLQSLESDNAIGGGSIMTLDREITGAAKRFVSFWNWLSRKFKLAAGCYLFCTREAFNSVGGFDEKQYAAEELVLSAKLKKYAKAHSKRFVILDNAPVVSSARKLEWYSRRQKLWQILMLLIPGATRSKKMLGMWYDRSQIRDKP